MTAIIDRRVVNTLFPDAKPRRMFPIGWLILWQAKRMFGGLWVGGDAILYDDRLTFEPNSLNKRVHADAESLSVCLMLSGLSGSVCRKGIGTNIVDVQTDKDVFSMRCYDADAFSNRIDAQIRLIKGRLQ